MNDCWRFLSARSRAALAITAIILCAVQARAQDPTSAILEKYAYENVEKNLLPDEMEKPGMLDVQYHEYRMVREQNRFYAIILTVATALAAHFLLLWRIGNRAPNDAVTGTGLIYIVFGTIVLVTLSDNKDQLTASMGILGAVAGYLFGRARPGPERRTDNAPAPDET